jgi:hypothetical protein
MESLCSPVSHSCRFPQAPDHDVSTFDVSGTEARHGGGQTELCFGAVMWPRLGSNWLQKLPKENRMTLSAQLVFVCIVKPNPRILLCMIPPPFRAEGQASLGG